MDPEGNGVNPGEGNGGGPGSPSGEEDKQLISYSGGDNTHGTTRKAGRQVRRDKKDPSSTEYVMLCIITILYVNSNSALCNHAQTSYHNCLFQENKSYGSKKPFAFIL
jgi:hypothetical protein